MANKTLELALRIVAEATGKQNIEQLVAELRRIEESAESANPATEQLAKQLDNTGDSAERTKAKAAVLGDVLDELGDQAELIRAFERSKRELEEQEIATAAAAHALDQLHKKATETDKPFVELARSLDIAETDLQQMRAELTQQITKHNALQAELKRTGVDTNNLIVAKRNLGAQFNQAGKAVDGFTQDLKEGNAAQQAHAVSLGQVAGQIAAVATAYFGLDQVGQAVRTVFETGDKFEKLGVQMQALMGGIAGGEQATKWIAEFTKNTPLQLGEVSQAFVKLKAFGLDPMDGTLQSITDSALKLGGGFQEVEGISLALGQAWAKQKLQGEEILQLVERGVPVWDMLQTVTGKNVEELNKLASSGALGRDVIKQLIDEMGRTSAGSAAAQMALFSGQVSNAKDNLEQFYNLIANSGAMDWLKSQITALNAQFAEMAADGRLQEWAQSISDTIVNTGEVIKRTVTTLYDYREEIATVAKVWLALKVGSYFSDVVAGAHAAITAFTSYRTAVVASTVATEAAAASALRWKNTIAFIARGGLYTALISEVINVGIEYNKLLTVEQQVEKSRQAATKSANQYAAELKLISDSTGVVVTNMAELDAAVASGILIMDEATGRYENAARKQNELAEATRLAAEAEQQRQAFLTLSLPQALEAVAALEKQAQSLNDVRDGVGGFIQTIESARAALAGAGEEYSQQITLIDTLKVKFVAHNESLERQKYLADDISAAYKELGLTSSQALSETATKLQGAFELIQQHNEPIALQQAAFLKWADAAVKAADATDQTVPASVQAAAAALGLTKELDKLIEKANALKPVVDTNSEAVARYQRELDKTNAAIATNQKVIASSTATAEQKAQAQAALTSQQVRLTEQTADLNHVQSLELATLGQLQGEQTALNRQINDLNERYRTGKISANEYNQQHERLSGLLRVVNQLLGDFKGAQDAATDATKRGTQATKEATVAAEAQSKSLREQKEELEKVQASANRTASSMNNLSNAARPSVGDIVDYQDKNEDRAYALDTKEIREERERRSHEQLQKSQYDKFEQEIKRTSDDSGFAALYQRIVKQLNYLDKEQRSALAALIQQQRDALRATTTTPNKPSGSAPRTTTPTTNYNALPSQSDTGLTTAIRDLINTLKQRETGKTITLRLQLPNGNAADLYASIRDELLDELERLSKTQ
ncbi:tape measure protein [Pseudoalteromonas xiamenensis]